MERNEEIEIDTRLGRRSIDTSKIVHFPRGLAGFEDEQDFVLLPLRPDAPLLILQSMKSPQLGLLVADPYCFLENYPLAVGEAELAVLQLSRLEDAAVLVTVTIPPGKPEDATLNLVGPVLINYQARIGLQVPQIIDGPARVSMHSPERGAGR